MVVWLGRSLLIFLGGIIHDRYDIEIVTVLTIHCPALHYMKCNVWHHRIHCVMLLALEGGISPLQNSASEAQSSEQRHTDSRAARTKRETLPNTRALNRARSRSGHGGICRLQDSATETQIAEQQNTDSRGARTK